MESWPQHIIGHKQEKLTFLERWQRLTELEEDWKKESENWMGSPKQKNRNSLIRMLLWG